MKLRCYYCGKVVNSKAKRISKRKQANICCVGCFADRDIRNDFFKTKNYSSYNET